MPAELAQLRERLEASRRHLEITKRKAPTSWCLVRAAGAPVDIGTESFIISKNLHRRHLTVGQRSMVAGRLANMEQGRPSAEIKSHKCNFSIEQAAQALNVSERSVSNAKTVLDSGDLEPSALMPEVSNAEAAQALNVDDAVPHGMIAATPSASMATAVADGRGGRFSKNQGARKPAASIRVCEMEKSL